MNWWQTALATVLSAGLLTLFGMLLTRNKEANDLAHKALASTADQFSVIETLKTIAWLQAVRLDQWESWGRDSTQTWNQTIRILESHAHDLPVLPEMPRPPEGHLDLRRYWRDIEKVVEDRAER